jgi:hypothetical protein
METQSDFTGQREAVESIPRRTKPDKRWTTLFIGDHGKVVTLKRFKSFVFFAGFIFILSLAAIVFLFWYNQNLTRKSDELQSSLDVLQKRTQALRHEKDILMARLVLAESRVKESLGETNENQEQKALQTPKQNASSQKLETQQFKIKEKAFATTPAAKPEVAAKPPEIILSVDVENFLVQHVSEQNKLKIQFKIKNTSPNSKRVSGHTIVVLKNDDLQPKMWFSVPPLGLVDGKPTGKQRGHRFAISYFRTMRFTANAPQALEKYNIAAVYVFGEDGEFLLEKDFPVEFAAQKPASLQPSTADDVLQSLKGTGSEANPTDGESRDQETEFVDQGQGPPY